MVKVFNWKVQEWVDKSKLVKLKVIYILDSRILNCR